MKTEMSTQQQGYEVIYGVTLLDDIHNYFPALLYEQNRFTTLSSIFQYVRLQMNSRFNLMAYGASRHADNTLFTTSPTPTVIFGEQPQPSTDVSLLLSLIGLGSLRNPVRDVRLPDPVVVSPTLEQIERASEIVTNISGACPICQEQILQNDICRRLNHCNHTYHRTCIDQWFRRSVFCPTCRHDVRVYSRDPEI